MNTFKFHDDGTIAENPVGHSIRYPAGARRPLLGDVVGWHTGRNALTGKTDTWLTVRDFDGRRWPIQPQATQVEVIR